MADILNAIIAIGGTTAHEHPKSVEAVLTAYVTGPEVVSSVVAEHQGRVIGWQSVGRWQDEAHIGTFVAPGIQASGAGGAMFAMTRAAVLAAGYHAIIAVIRSDNVPGLAYYARQRFSDVVADPDFALNDGTVVGRVVRRLDLV